jgi:hypothetical protein
MSEHDFEPIRGLPGNLPEGEVILWQGEPKWTLLACQAFHVRAVAAYFAAMLGWRVFAAIRGGTAPLQALEAVVMVAPIALVAVGILALLAWLNSRTTVYTLTNRRIVMRFGVAFPKAINFPLPLIDSAAVKAEGKRAGDLALTLKPPNKIAFMQLWPHARPWRLTRPQPTFRALADVQPVAALLVSAMKAQAQIERPSLEPAMSSRRIPEPLTARPEASAA